MKKTSINLLCILIIGILTASVIMPAYYIGASLGKGFKTGLEIAEKQKSAEGIDFQTVEFYLEPEANMLINPQDSVTFDDGRTYPMIVQHASVVVDSESVPRWPQWTWLVCYVLTLVICILLIVEFIKFVININKGEVFVTRNVTLLRRFALYLIVIASLNVVSGISQEILLSTLNLRLEGYAIGAYWMIPWSNLLLGLLALLIAQVWSRGIALEEEQQLTV